MSKKRLHKMAIQAWLIGTALVISATAAAQSHSSGVKSIPRATMVLQQMHLANQAQIKAAKLARKKAKATGVQRYADRLWRDHQVAGGKIKTLAQQLGISLKTPAQMRQKMHKIQSPQKTSGGSARGVSKPMQQMKKNMRRMQQMLAKLKSVTGSQFDATYVKAMAKSQRHMRHMLQGVLAQNLNQPQLVGLIDKLIPILGQHVTLAQHLQRRSAP